MGNSFVDREEKDRLDQAEAKKVSKRKVSKKKNSSTGSRVKIFRQILNGEVLTKSFIVDNLFFLFFIGGLLVLLISKGYYSRQLSGEIDKTQKEIGEINSRLVSDKIRFNDRTDRVNMTEKLNAKKLTESESGIEVIRVDEW